jgi:diguanylate cyclase (GGDEF)-like protein
MPDADITRRRVWLRDAEGKARCYAVSVRNLFDQAGAVAGTRGVAQDVTAQDQHDAAIASALRRGELLEHITRQMHEEVLAPRMIRAILEALANALGAGGAVLLSSLSGLPAEMLRHAAGNPPEPVLRRIADPAHLRATAPLILDDAENHVILLCPAATRNGEQILLGLWRDRGQRAWDSDDRALVASIAGVIGVVLAHEAVQRQMALQGASDALTGLLNRRSFLAEMTRRINRSEHDARSCVLMLINLNNFKSVNEVWGYEAGDDCLRCFGAELRAIFRPTDLIARLGGDEFAVLMDGGDHFTAGERAEQLCHEAKLHFLHWAVGRKPAPCVSAGIAYRAPCSGEGIDSLMRRADLALSRVKPGGRGGWLVSHDEAIG